MQFTKGRIVKSNAGHDKNSFYVVVERKDDVCYIADGKRRKLAKPKAKNIKHLSPTSQQLVIEALTSDRDLRSKLHGLNYPNEPKH